MLAAHTHTHTHIYIFFTVDWVLQLILIMPVERARILARFFFHSSLSVSPFFLFFFWKEAHTCIFTRDRLIKILWRTGFSVASDLRMQNGSREFKYTPAKAVKLDIYTYTHTHIYYIYVPTG